MTDTDIDDIKKRANDIRARTGMTKIPFHATEIAKKLGIEVDNRTTNLGKLYHAGSITKNSNGTLSIWVNPSDSKERQNFTIAHELGHYSNGDLDSVHLGEIRDTSETLTLDRKAGEHNPMEWKANEFAAELIMPEANVREKLDELLKKDKNLEVSDAVADLARKFGVSKAAMLVRFKFLGIIKKK